MKFVKGNAVTALINGDADTLMHCCNCQNTFGGGIAKEIRERVPEAYKADSEAFSETEQGMILLGGYSESGSILYQTDEHSVINLYGQNHFGIHKRQVNYAALFSAITSCLTAYGLRKELKSVSKNAKIAIPYKMGCDRAGGDWDYVSTFIEDIEEIFNVDFIVYSL
jgi:O-acetyl-ADP-ribose deacetylase (regulator of RNase III)